MKAESDTLLFGDAVRLTIPPNPEESEEEYVVSGYIVFIDDYYLSVRTRGLEFHLIANIKTYLEDKRKGSWYYETSVPVKVERIPDEEVSTEGQR